MKKIDINKIKENSENPRYITEEKFDKLLKSISEFPEMLEVRELVIDENFVVLGGNMRLKALKAAGVKEVPVKQVKGWTEQQKKEFIIKDNIGFGQWDWDILGNESETVDLKGWGMDVWQPEENVDYSILEDIDLEEEIANKETNVKRGIMIEFDSNIYDEANNLINEYRKKGENLGLIVLKALKDI